MAQRNEVRKRTCKHCGITTRVTAATIKRQAATCSYAPGQILTQGSNKGDDLPSEGGQEA